MKAWQAIRAGWERFLFAAIGLACFAFSFRNILRDDMTAAATTFAIGFFSFLYSNVSRFKRFKGLGFEAELWEDKQKEAASLIERLKGVVSVYTREVVMARVMSGRMGGAANWRDNWSLYDELVTKHDELGQALDLTGLKSRLIEIMIFDACCRLTSKIGETVRTGNQRISEQIKQKFGSPIRDAKAYGVEIQNLRKVAVNEKDLFIRSASENIAKTLLESAKSAQSAAKLYFGFEFGLEDNVVNDLQFLSELYERRPFELTPTILERIDEIMHSAS